MRGLAQLDTFHKTRGGYLVFGLAELALAYAAVLWAFDSGSLWLYMITLILIVGALQNFVKLVGKAAYGLKARRTR